VLFETDCKQVVDDISSSVAIDSGYGYILFFYRQKLSLIHNLHVSFIRIQANKVAHVLTRVSRFHVSPVLFFLAYFKLY
ncbi:hypothetical protein glysoja_038601, partial [Glycine soja]